MAAPALALDARALAPPRWLALLRAAAPLLAGVALAALLQFVLRESLGHFTSKLLIGVGINIVLAVSLNIVNGFTGQFSLGHAAFMAVGGYAAGIVTYYGSMRLWGSAALYGGHFGAGEWLFVAACLVGGLAAAALGYLVGLPSLRLRGDYLAIVTLGFNEIVRVILTRSRGVIFDPAQVEATPLPQLVRHVGGAVGFGGLPFYTNLFWTYLFVTLTLLAAYRLKFSSQGRAFLAIRENEIAAEAIGVPVTRYKVRAFVVAAAFAGIAGSLFAHDIGTTLNPRELGFQKSIDIVIMVVLGGMGSICGSVLAAILLTILPEWLRSPTHVWPAGLAVLALVLFMQGRRSLRPAVTVIAITLAFEILRALARWRGIDLSQYRMILYALTLILMMILRPQGLFGVHELWELRPAWWPRSRSTDPSR